ncbi:MAG: peptide-methionine (S)-S-oxide reductase MsrA [Nanoarchaeota archaeon]|nr:peptide-methionine (S)-S-oxide reductase MsrA [Nanoarchaeota archaeon]
MEKATFAAGCFWHIEEVFEKALGVISTLVGYTGGKMKNPSYANVCSGATGHMEAVEVTFNREKISYEKLLDVFWNIHDPTTKDRQGLDVGSQYNSAIFYHNEAQKKTAIKSKAERQKQMQRKIVTKIKRATKFWPAEEYHQKYMEKHKRGFF